MSAFISRRKNRNPVVLCVSVVGVHGYPDFEQYALLCKRDQLNGYREAETALLFFCFYERESEI